jgi:hypothetical protein
MVAVMNRRAAVLAFALALFPALTLTVRADVAPANASVSLLVSLDELVATSTHIVVATPVDRRSVWEEVGQSRRIVTYVRLQVHSAVAGAPGSEVWVRTLGGAVGGVGQSVSGEAQLVKGAKALFFLSQVDGAHVVTARAQGHYLVRADGKLGPSPEAGALLPRRGPVISAREALVGVTIDEAVRTVSRARARHGAK